MNVSGLKLQLSRNSYSVVSFSEDADYSSHASPSYPQDYLKHFKKAVVCWLIAALGGTCILVGRQDMGRIIAHAKCQMNMRCSLKAQRRPGEVRRMPSRREGLEVSR